MAGEILGKIVLDSIHNEEIKTAISKEIALETTFPDLKVEEDTTPHIEDTKTITLYLWYSNEPAFNIYKLLRNYLTEGYGIDSAIMLKLIETKNMDLEDTLFKLPYIHSGYIATIVPENQGASSE